MSTRLKIAIQKKGRLADYSFDLLKKIGLDVVPNGRFLILKCKDFAADVMLLRDDDIPRFVAQGSADIGFVGQNVVWESEEPVREVLDLGFGRCRLVVAVPKKSRITKFSQLRGAMIGTEYVNATKKFFKQLKIPIQVTPLTGSAEIAPELGACDAIVDLVDTGTTLETHGLVPLDPPVFVSTAVLVANKKLAADKQALLIEIVDRISAVQKALGKKYVMLNCREVDLPAIKKILPALDSPTVLPLSKSGEYAVHSVVTEKEFWAIVPRLKKAGAKDILLLPIEKLVP